MYQRESPYHEQTPGIPPARHIQPYYRAETSETRVKESIDATRCLCCSDLYSISCKCESWMYCGECGQWTHRACAGYERGGFMCEISAKD